MHIDSIFKRDFTKKSFELEKITDAILKAMLSVNNGDVRDAEKISSDVYNTLLERKKDSKEYAPNVEEIQDLVEQKLMQSEFLDVAKAYILYRNEQAQRRERNLFEKKLL